MLPALLLVSFIIMHLVHTLTYNNINYPLLQYIYEAKNEFNTKFKSPIVRPAKYMSYIITFETAYTDSCIPQW